MPQRDLRQLISDLEAMLNGTHPPPNIEAVDVTTQALFGGLFGVSLPNGSLELMPGLELHQTFAHLFATPMVAFAPPPNPRAPHPPPWHATHNGSVAETITVELRLAAGAKPFDLERGDCLRLVASMMRLLAAVPVTLPLLSNVAFSGVAQSDKRPNIWQIEVSTRWPSFSPVALDEPFIELLRLLLEPASIILQDDDVNRAFALADGIWWLPTLSAQMTGIWSAAEILMRPGRARTGEQLAKCIRAYIGKSRSHGDRIYNDVTRLYGARGSTAHAGRSPQPDDVRASFLLVREILLRAFAEKQRPPTQGDIVSLW